MHTSPAYAEDVYIGSHSGIDSRRPPGDASWCRSTRPASPSSVPQDLRPPREPVPRAAEPAASTSWTGRCGSTTCWCRGIASSSPSASPEPIASWLLLAPALLPGWPRPSSRWGSRWRARTRWGSVSTSRRSEYLMDLVVDVQTVRTCQTAAELDPELTTDGYAFPAAPTSPRAASPCRRRGSGWRRSCESCPARRSSSRRRTRIWQRLRWRPGSRSRSAGGGYTALQRAALLQLAADHVASALDGRESAFELHANGGLVAWRARLRQCFSRYNELANGVLQRAARRDARHRSGLLCARRRCRSDDPSRSTPSRPGEA